MAQYLFIADPLDTFKIYKDSTFAMMRAAQRRGHQVWFCELAHLQANNSQVSAEASRLRLTGDSDVWYEIVETVRQPLPFFDGVIIRKDPPFDSEYLFATHLLELAEKQGVRVYNRPQALRDHNEKLAILQFPEWIAPTCVSRDMATLRAFVAEQGEAILKPLDSMGGDGIFRVSVSDLNLSVILETITLRGTRTVMAQRYIPQISEGDKRVLLINGNAVPFALARIPQAGETRGNLAAGGRGEARPITEREAAIANALGPILKARGLMLVGLDVIGGFLTEINVTSPTCFQEITDQTGTDVAGLFIDALEAVDPA